MKKLKIGIIGTGGIAHSHANAYMGMEDVELAAGADIVDGKAREFFDSLGLKNAGAFNSAKEMFESVKLDAVSVCTYNTTHAVCAVEALKAGCHVLLEKPMTVTLDDAKAIIKAEKETGKILTIGFQPRYDSRMKKIKEIVQSGTLGKIYYIQTGGGRRRGMPGKTFIEKKYAGVGALADIGCYSLDMVLNSIGYPKPLTVSAVAYDYFGKNPKYTPAADAARFNVDDFCGAFIRLEGGITLDFRMSWAMHMDSTGATIFLGTDAGLKVEPAAPANNPLWGGAWDGSCGDVSIFHDVMGVPTHTPIPMRD
ncbi:MAG: Gfo/Idh/MocA family oxidoreductase, partial [Treponema sp.]|nr:Gfo/Idh/MocA family oxidoreductase [Treponema sp.]